MRVALLALLVVGFVSLGLALESGSVARFQVVIDPGHGGDDLGARGEAGLLEKDVALQVAQRVGRLLVPLGIEVTYTREDDRFLSLQERSDLANRSGADLYLSIHANAAEDRSARGPETFFLSLEASDDEALRVALAENAAFGIAGVVPGVHPIVGQILGDLSRSQNLRSSSEVAAAIQRRLSRLPGPSRGVKQAPFVVLMGVQMPAVLVEIGFITNAEEERRLRSGSHQQVIAQALASAIESYRDGRGRLPRKEAAR